MHAPPLAADTTTKLLARAATPSLLRAHLSKPLYKILKSKHPSVSVLYKVTVKGTLLYFLRIFAALTILHLWLPGVRAPPAAGTKTSGGPASVLPLGAPKRGAVPVLTKAHVRGMATASSGGRSLRGRYTYVYTYIHTCIGDTTDMLLTVCAEHMQGTCSLRRAHQVGGEWGENGGGGRAHHPDASLGLTRAPFVPARPPNTPLQDGHHRPRSTNFGEFVEHRREMEAHHHKKDRQHYIKRRQQERPLSPKS